MHVCKKKTELYGSIVWECAEVFVSDRHCFRAGILWWYFCVLCFCVFQSNIDFKVCETRFQIETKTMGIWGEWMQYVVHNNSHRCRSRLFLGRAKYFLAKFSRKTFMRLTFSPHLMLLVHYIFLYHVVIHIFTSYMAIIFCINSTITKIQNQIREQCITYKAKHT